MTRLVVLVLLGIALTACKKTEEPSQATPPALPALPSVPAVATAAVPADTAEIPTEEDFEADAERQITSQNLEAELDKLEKEIADR